MKLEDALYIINKIAKQDCDKSRFLYSIKEDVIAKLQPEVLGWHKIGNAYANLYKIGDRTFHAKPHGLGDCVGDYLGKIEGFIPSAIVVVNGALDDAISIIGEFIEIGDFTKRMLGVL